MDTFFFDTTLVPADARPFEVVERKGIGHPDTLADGIAESVSLTYAQYCLERFGVILHHNVDKTIVLGGLAEIGFGIGRLVKPHRVIINGRMSDQFAETRVDVPNLQTDAAKMFLHRALPYLDVEHEVQICPCTTVSSSSPTWFRPRSLEDLPDAVHPRANDTSVCAGFWPYSTIENLVLELESSFYQEDGQSPEYDFLGQDIKIMATRRLHDVTITLCVPFLSQRVPNIDFYEEHVAILRQQLLDRSRQLTQGRFNISVRVNAEDLLLSDRSSTQGRYLLASGSALDYGEEGVVGRGNRSCGFISSTRPYSIEAVCGKNPVYHVGKVYAYVADTLARQIAEAFQCECQIVLVTQNGKNLYDPHCVFVQLSKPVPDHTVRDLILSELETRKWTREIVEKKPFVPRIG